MPTLEAERLLLRPPATEDAAFFAAALADYDVTRNLATVPYPYTEADAADFITTVTRARAAGEGWVYTILSKATGSPLGCCGVHLQDGRYELGYWIAILGPRICHRGGPPSPGLRLRSGAGRNRGSRLVSRQFRVRPGAGAAGICRRPCRIQPLPGPGGTGVVQPNDVDARAFRAKKSGMMPTSLKARPS